jgi:CDGSH-type Zn-finger protein/uncharacterized Fe-S cluster protein YjdI
MAVEEVDGKAATVRFDGGRCIHARRCVMGAPAVFRAGVKGGWIEPDAASAEELLRVAYACPSGAITVERKDGGAQEAPPRANLVTVRENGPLAVHAELTVEGHGGMTRATLCRCGLSKNKPFCDNAHRKGGFVASGEPASREMTLAITDLVGPVTVTPRVNGPLVVVGRFEIDSGTGRAVDRVEKAVFCRCGHSANKPFCDGSHKRVGFEAP